MLLLFALRYSHCLHTAWCCCCSPFVKVTVCRQRDAAAVRCSLYSLFADCPMLLLFALRYSHCLHTTWCCFFSLFIRVSFCRQHEAAAVGCSLNSLFADSMMMLLFRCSLQSLSGDTMILLLFAIRFNHCLHTDLCCCFPLFVTFTLWRQHDPAAVRFSLYLMSAVSIMLLLFAVH